MVAEGKQPFSLTHPMCVIYFSSRPLKLCLVAQLRWERWLCWAWSHSSKRCRMICFYKAIHITCVYFPLVSETFFFLKGKFYLEDLSGTVQLDMSKAISFKCLSRLLQEKNIQYSVSCWHIFIFQILNSVGTSFTMACTQNPASCLQRVSQLLLQPCMWKE